jgi:hypothetical protein
LPDMQAMVLHLLRSRALLPGEAMTDLEAAVELMHEALKFYADKSNWKRGEYEIKRNGAYICPADAMGEQWRRADAALSNPTVKKVMGGA